MSVLTVSGIGRSRREGVDTAVTESCDIDSQTDKFAVCPRVVSLKGQTSCRIPVKIFNMTAKVIHIKPKTILCDLTEVKVLRQITPEVEKNSDVHPTCKSDEIGLEDLGVKVDSEIPKEDREKLNCLLEKWKCVFSKGPTDLGFTTLIEHEINLEDNTPFKEPFRRIPPSMYEEVREHLREMLESGAIRESSSPYSSNVVLIRKKDGSLRLCIDYRKLNSRTIKDSYYLPRIDETIDCLAGSRYFTKLDLRSAYWQCGMKESDKCKTAFNLGPLGFYESNRLAFGLTNACASFQRLIERCMGEMHLRECLIFLDDIIIFSKTVEEHLQRLESVFKRLKQHGLKLSSR